MVTRNAKIPGAFLLRNYQIQKSPHQGAFGWYARDAARATSAAPFYFAPFKKDGTVFRDGGIGYNNPTALSVDEVCAISGTNAKECVDLVVSLGMNKFRLFNV